MSEPATTTPTTADLRQYRQETRETADGLAWTYDRLLRQQYTKLEKAEMRRKWEARTDDHLRHLIVYEIQKLRTHADELPQWYPDAFDPILAVERLIELVAAGGPTGLAERTALADELRYVAAELRSREPVTRVR
jgi:hypothetical protein